MKKRIALLLAFLILSSVCLSSCNIAEYLFKPVREYINVQKYSEPFTFISVNSAVRKNLSQSASAPYDGVMPCTPPSPPPQPWDYSLYMKGTVDSGIVEGGEDIELNFTMAANDNVLSGGDLHIVFDTNDYTVKHEGKTCEDNTFIIKDFFEDEKYSNEIQEKIMLCPDYQDGWACSYVSIWVRFVPHDIEEFAERMMKSDDYFDYGLERLSTDGYISLAGSAISYCADSVETWLRYGTSFGDVFNDLSTYHYSKGLISTEEMATLTFGYRYQYLVNVSTTTHPDDPEGVRIGYYSKNIRYESTYCVNDEKLSDAIRAHEEFWETEHYQTAKGGLNIALRILEIMKERGVITEEEYQKELIWLDEVRGIYYPHSGGRTKYDEVNEFFITHKD